MYLVFNINYIITLGVDEEERLKQLLVDELESDSFLKDKRFTADREFFSKCNYALYFSLQFSY